MNRRSCILIALMWMLPVCRANAQDFSPDGSQIVYAGKSGIMLCSINDAVSRPIPGGEGGTGALWSPTGDHIVFAVPDRASGSSRAVLYDTRSGRSRTVADGLEPPFAWREDGNRFAGIRRMEGIGLQIVLVNVVGGQADARMIPVQQVVGRQMVWIPATDNIAFIGRNGRSQNLYLYQFGEVKQITTSNDVIGIGLWQDRKRVVWARHSRNTRYILASLYLADVSTNSAPVRLNFPAVIPEINPRPAQGPVSVEQVVFSPRSNRLSMVCTFSPSPGRLTQVCYSINMDGTDVRTVRSGQPSEKRSSLIHPFFSYDGSQLALLHSDAGVTVLGLFDARGANGKRLSEWR
jgi:Tol biopolymer transport system component